jgi:class 3 adenylate cyclase
VKRKVAAILAADIVGFSRLVAEDEDGTLRQLATYRNVLDDFVVHRGGRVFNMAGDSIMCEFESPLEATRAAVEIQDHMRAQNLALPQGRRLQFRIGISMGEVVERHDDLLGTAVNIAARLEALAPPGGICLSRAVHEAVAGQIAVPFDDLGERQVKNIPFPVHAYTMAGPDAGICAEPQRSPARALTVSALSVAGACRWSNGRRAPALCLPLGRPLGPPVARQSDRGVLAPRAEGRTDRRSELRAGPVP